MLLFSLVLANPKQKGRVRHFYARLSFLKRRFVIKLVLLLLKFVGCFFAQLLFPFFTFAHIGAGQDQEPVSAKKRP